MSATILVVDDDERLRETLGVLVRSLGHQAIMAADVPSAERVLTERELDLVISDLRMPGGSGLDLLARARVAAPDVPVIVSTSHPSSLRQRMSSVPGPAIDWSALWITLSST